MSEAVGKGGPGADPDGSGDVGELEGPTGQTGLPPLDRDDQLDDDPDAGADFRPEATALDPDPTRLSSPSASGVVAELRAILEDGTRKLLPLYRLPDQIVVGRGSGVDWRLDDGSLSRQHVQLKWSGSKLTVEDLGSANGTRVGGRPVRAVTPVEPGDLLQMGAVSVVLELRQGDEQPTRQVELPESGAVDDADFADERLVAAKAAAAPAAADPTGPSLALPPAPQRDSFPPLAGTLIKATEARGAAQVFRPTSGYARPDEPTRPWDPRAALVRKRSGVAAQLPSAASLSASWQKSKRPFILGGVTVLLALFLCAWWIVDALTPPAQETRTARTAERDVGPGPKVTSLAPPLPPTTPTTTSSPIVTKLAPDGPALSPAQRDQALLDAISAYEQAHYAEALEHFEPLADAGDPPARFMVQLLRRKSETAR